MPDWKPHLRKELVDSELDPARELEIVEELSQHLDDQFDELVSHGRSEEQATRQVLEDLRSNDSLAQRIQRTQRPSPRNTPVLGGEKTHVFDSVLQDFRYGLRLLRKNPAFTIVVVFTLALGIGANTALFTALDAIMFRPLVARDPGRLILIAKSRNETFSFPFYERLRDALSSAAGLAASQFRVSVRPLTVTGASDPVEISTQGVTGNFFDLLGVPPLMGRTFVLDDDRKGAPQPVVMISHAFWVSRFAADPNIVGRVVQLSDVPVTIIGVMPPNFVGFSADVQPDFWWPLQLISQLEPGGPGPMGEGVSWLVLFGRLKNGATRLQAQAEASVFFHRELETQLAGNPNRPSAERARILSQTLEVRPGGAGFVAARDDFQQPLLILMTAVAVVLLIACSNIGGLLFARGVARQRELAVRMAVGAQRGRIIRQLMSESVLLAFLGGAAGIILARLGVRFISNFIAQSGFAVPIVPDHRALLFTLAVSAFSGVFFGFVPAWLFCRVDVITAVKSHGNAVAGVARSRVLPTLMIAQVALSVLLLAGAGLFVRTLRNLRSVEVGFQRSNLICLSIDRGRMRLDAAKQELLLRGLLAELPTAPGIRSASIGGAGLLTGNGIIMDVEVEGYSRAPDEEMRTSAILAGPGFFDALGVSLLRGRDFTPADESRGSAPAHANVAIIGEKMADRFFPSADPIGKRITVEGDPKVTLEIVGVARDTRYSRDLRAPIPLQFYVPFFGSGIHMPPTFYIRSDQSVAAVSGGIREVIKRVAPDLKVKEIRAMDELIDRLLLRERIIAQLVGFFSVFALLLACLGVYGMLSLRVAQSVREIGVRMALGATVARVLRSVIWQGLKFVVLGIAIGALAALFVTRFVAALLYGVTPEDPTTFVAVSLLLVAAAALSAWIPARRAAKLDPMLALRCE